MRRKLVSVVLSVGLVVAAAGPVWAHHAFAAEFDASKPLKFGGTLTKVEFVNPHSWFYVEVEDADGTMVEWAVEAGNPNALFRRGMNKNTFPPGIEIVVDGYQSKDGSNRMNGRDITLPGGENFFLGSSGTGAPDPNQNPTETP